MSAATKSRFFRAALGALLALALAVPVAVFVSSSDVEPNAAAPPDPGTADGPIEQVARDPELPTPADGTSVEGVAPPASSRPSWHVRAPSLQTLCQLLAEKRDGTCLGPRQRWQQRGAEVVRLGVRVEDTFGAVEESFLAARSGAADFVAAWQSPLFLERRRSTLRVDRGRVLETSWFDSKRKVFSL
jgi:hypothetical protein